MSTVYEKNLLRKSHRIELPAKVVVDGKEFKVLDWSLEGFKCEIPENGIAENWQGKVTFKLLLSGMNVTFDAEARLRRKGAEQSGFSFENLNDRSKMLLKAYLEAGVEGKLDDIQGVIAKAEAVEVPVETDRPLTVEERTVFRRKFRGRAIVYWTLGPLGVFFILFVFYNNFSRAVSTRAVVSGALIDMAPEVSGYLKSVAVVEGQSVKKGQLLFVVDDAEILRNINQIKLEVEVEKERLAMLYTRLSEEERELGLYRNAADLKVEMMEQRIAAVKAKIDLTEKEFERARMLIADGAVSRSVLDLRRKEYLESKAQLAELGEELELAQRNALSAKNGKYLSDGAARGEREELQSSILVQKRELEACQYRLVQAMAHLEDTRVTAERAGTVYSVKRIPGTFLRAGESVMTLSVEHEQPWVLARFTFQDALRLAPGDKAEIWVPSMERHLVGTIRALGHHAMAAGGVTSQDLEISMNEVPVKISLDEPVEGLVSGLGVETRVRTRLLESMPLLSVFDFRESAKQ